MPQRLRIFVSSPADVRAERLRAGLIVDKLSQDFGRFFAIESYQWEHEAMLASKHFQDAIEPPSAFDIVVLILWSRLGTPLPRRTTEREYRGIDGRAPVTGTEWEYEEALKVAREKGAPDLLAFRNISPAPIDPRDTDAQAKTNTQLDALNAFWARHFTDRGLFLAANNEYRTLEEFALRLEESLRKLIERRVKSLAARETREPIWLGDPFRGLEPYEFEHAPIFFGRDAPVTKATEQLASNARSGRAFLLVSGASGSGKSSLVRAGIVPRLMKPQRISGIAFLRRTMFRLGSEGSNVILGLAKALTCADRQDVGLPELIAPGQNATQLAAHLCGAVGQPGYLFANALGRLTEARRKSGHLLAFEEAKLILVVDQLEELFTVSGISLEDRRLFIQLLSGLARSGAVWVIATLRADFWHRAAEIPELIVLAEGPGRIDLAAPSPAELAEVIRKPAQAAGLLFEAHPVSGLGFDAVLAEDAAAAPGALPLLSFTLDELYRNAKARGDAVLTYTNYEALGGLEGAIARRAGEIVAALPAAAQAALPRVLRELTTVIGTTDQAPVARSAPLEIFVEGSPARTLIDAFIAARLLVAADERGAVAMVRLAHEALIVRWQRAREQLAADHRDLETRTLVERQFGRWSQTRGGARRLLLLRNPDLANALDLATRWGHELDAPMRDYIKRSARRARLTRTLTAAASGVFAIVAIGAVVAERDATVERIRAEDALSAATETANTLVTDLAEKFATRQGMPIDLVREVLDRARGLQDQLINAGETAPQLRFSAAKALDRLVLTLLEQGDMKARADIVAARRAADRFAEIMAELVRLNPGNSEWQYELSLSRNRLGDVLMLAGNVNGALDAFNSGLVIRQKLNTIEPTSPKWKYALLDSYAKVGDALMKLDRRDEALDAYESALTLGRELVDNDQTNNLSWQRELAVAYERTGIALKSLGEFEEALESFTASLQVRQRLSMEDVNTERSRDLAVGHDWVGDILAEMGEYDGALVEYQKSFAIREKLAADDPGNSKFQRDQAVSYGRIGEALIASGHRDDGLDLLRKNLRVRDRLASADPGNALWQADLVTALRRLAIAGDDPAARLSRALEIASQLDREGKLGLDQKSWVADLKKDIDATHK
jgi:tetratricopeptide (TPR) repeat protein